MTGSDMVAKENAMRNRSQPRLGKADVTKLLSLLYRNDHWLLALVPFAYLIGVVVECAVAVPYWDQWDLVLLLDKAYRGEITLHDFWAQHNEHRPFVPRLIMLGLARLTRWNIYYELVVNIALALGLFVVFVCQIRITQRTLGAAGLHWAIPISSVIVFSISQYQNWLWGWQIQMILNVLLAMGGIVLLANGEFSWRRFGGAALLGMAATYSFANGVLFWPVGLLILLVKTRGGREAKSSVAGWILLSALTLASYGWHYQRPAEHPQLNLVFQMPVEYGRIVLKFIGGICGGFSESSACANDDLALGAGLAGIAALGWAVCWLSRRQSAGIEAVLPYVGMSAYSLGSALLTGAARVGFGSQQGLASRYCTLAAPLWIALSVLLILLVSGGKDSAEAAGPLEHSDRERVFEGYRTVAVCLLVGAVSLLIGSSLFSTVGAKLMSSDQALGRQCLLELAATPQPQNFNYGPLSTLHPRPQVIVERYPILVTNRLSVFSTPRE
jgi:hypothetical protein